MVEREQPVPCINYELCDGCGNCVEVCPEKALVLEGLPLRPHLLSIVECSYCGLCEDTCPMGAITLTYEIYFG